MKPRLKTFKIIEHCWVDRGSLDRTFLIKAKSSADALDKFNDGDDIGEVKVENLEYEYDSEEVEVEEV